MAIQSNLFTYNGVQHSAPYFRVASHFNLSDDVIAVDIHMWETREDYKGNPVEEDGLFFPNKKSQIETFPLYVTVSKNEVPGYGLPNNSVFLNFISEKVVEHLKTISPSSSFEVIDIVD